MSKKTTHKTPSLPYGCSSDKDFSNTLLERDD